MYVCSITDNVIATAESVVTKPITQSNVIVGESLLKLFLRGINFLSILGNMAGILRIFAKSI